jgi:FkbM family methyltransferase
MNIIDLLATNGLNLNMVDIGCSGPLNTRWNKLLNEINYYGFDPNKEECERLEKDYKPFRSTKFLPYAISGNNGKSTLYKTKSIFCYSLLKPDMDILGRFTFADLFELQGQDEIDAITLDSCPELIDVNIDILKIDAQGLEKFILSGSTRALESALYVETESGFTPNYIGESTQAEVDMYMREKGFLLFDLTLFKMPYNNEFAHISPSNGQLLWSESVWLKDLIKLYADPGKTLNDADRIVFLKMLVLCAVVGCYDYGLAIAIRALQLNLINQVEFDTLSNFDNWQLGTEQNGEVLPKPSLIYNFILRLLPFSLRYKLFKELEFTLKQKHILKFLSN